MNDPEPPGAIELLAACLDDGICVLGEHSCIVPEVGCGSSAARLQWSMSLARWQARVTCYRPDRQVLPDFPAKRREEENTLFFLSPG